MYKKFICNILVVALLNLVGCYSFESITVPEYKQIEKEEGKPAEIYVLTKDGEKYHFLKDNFYIENDILYGKGKLLLGDREELIDKKIALSDIVLIEVENFDLGDTCLLSGGILLGVGLIFFIIFAATYER
jgi:hypothetical protein